MANARALYLNNGVQRQLQDVDVLLANGMDVFATIPATLNLFSGTNATTTVVNFLTGLSNTTATLNIGTGLIGVGNTINIGGLNSKVDIGGDLEVSGDEVVVGDTIFRGTTQIGDAPTDTLDIQAVVISDINFDGTAQAINNTGADLTIKTTTSGIVALAPASGSDLTLTTLGIAGEIKLASASTDGAGAIQLDASAGGVSIDAAGASNLTTSAGAMTVQGVGLNLEAGTGAFDLQGDTASTINVSAAGLGITAANTSTWQTTTGTLTLIGFAGATFRAGTDSTTSLLSAGTGTTSVTSGSGGIDITGHGPVDITTATTAHDINIAPFSGGDIVMSVTGAGVLDINAATGGIDIDSGAFVTINAAGNSHFTTSTGSMTIQSGAGGLDLIAAGSGVDITAAGASTFAVTLNTLTLSTTGLNNISVNPGSGQLAVSTAHINTAISMTVNSSGTPSSASIAVGTGAPTHSGQTGDLYLDDSAGAPYYCTGTTFWTQVGSATGFSSLQQAYDTGSTIATAGSAPIDFTLTSGGFNVTTSAAGDIQFDNGTSNYLFIDGSTGATTLSALAAQLTLSTISSGEIDITSAGAVDINATGAVTVDGTTIGITGSSIATISSVGSSLWTNSTGQLQLITTSSGEIDITSAGAVDINASTGVTVDGTAISIDGTAASNLSVTGANLTLSTLANTGVAGGDVLIDAVRDVTGGSITMTADYPSSWTVVGTSAAASLSLTTSTLGYIVLDSAEAVIVSATGSNPIYMAPGTDKVEINTGGANRVLVLDSSSALNNISFELGDGAPGAVTANNGSLYMNSNAGGLYMRIGGSWVEVAGAGADTLQEAYNASSAPALIEMVANKDLAFETLYHVTTPSNFFVQHEGGGNNFIATTTTSATAGTVQLGSANVTVEALNTLGFTGTNRIVQSTNAAMTVQTVTAGLLTLAGASGVTVTSTGGTLTLNGATQLVDINSAALDIDASGAITVDGTSTLTFTATSGQTTFACTGQKFEVNATTIDLNSVGAVTVDAAAASNFTVAAANLTLSTTTSGTLAVSSAAALDLDGVAVTLDASGGFSIDGSGGACNVSATAQNLTLSTITSGSVNITAAGLGNIQFNALSMVTPITLNQSGDLDLDGFTATSIIGALNELKADAGSGLVSTYVIANGVTIVAGDAVYIDTDGKVALTDSDAAATAKFLGIAKTGGTGDVGGTVDADVYIGGEVTSTAIGGTAPNEGDYVYLSGTAGDLTVDAPTSGILLRVGVITDATTNQLVIQVGTPVEL